MNDPITREWDTPEEDEAWAYLSKPALAAVDYTKLTPQDRRKVRLQYIEQQNGLCYFCKEKLSEGPAKHVAELEVNKKLFPKNFFDHPIHLQHNHDTGMTEGAVHAQCNAVMWQYLHR